MSFTQPSRMIGPYRLIAGLGRGGQAEVFLAVKHGPSGFSKLIVVKSIRPELEHDPRSRDALVSEARLAARLQHPNVVQTLEVGDEAGHLYIAMEFLDGQPLSRLDRAASDARKPLGLPVIATVVCDMLAGLHAAHELRNYDDRPLEVIHRDVSPQNVFVTYQGEVKLVDFGVAKAATGGVVTETGIVKGKPAYMAPEQSLGRSIDRRIDVYAAGIIAWELCVGRRLFDGDTPLHIATQQHDGPQPRLATVAPGISEAVAAVIDKALAYDRDQRWATAGQMREALEAALEASGLRRASREEVGALVSGLFTRERADLQEQIRLSLAASEQVTGDGLAASPLRSLATADLRTWNQRPAQAFPRKLMLAVGGGAAALALILLGLHFAPRPGAQQVSLRLCGSRTIGNALASSLIEGFFRHRGIPAVERAAEGVKVTHSGAKLTISVEAAGSAAAFKDLAAGRCDLGMASRTMSAEEAKIAGDLRAPATEHVIALDAIAIIVHPSNPVRALDIDQVKGIFTGAIKDWAQVGGAPGPIEASALDEQSTTWDTFKNVALGSHELAAGTPRFDDSARLSDHVSAEPTAIGFVGLAFVRSAAVVATSQRNTDPTVPSPFTVASESYPLSRRLYLYSLPKPRTPLATDFVDFVLSNEGQQIVGKSGFVDLSIAVRSPQQCDARCPAEYAELTKGAQRLTLDFRFREEKGGLDSRAARDVDRLVGFLRDYRSPRVLLLGFADTLPLSLERAQVAAAELSRRGVRAEVVRGFGPALQVWPGDDEAGRQRNRRVEVWIGK